MKLSPSLTECAPRAQKSPKFTPFDIRSQNPKAKIDPAIFTKLSSGTKNCSIQRWNLRLDRMRARMGQRQMVDGVFEGPSQWDWRKRKKGEMSMRRIKKKLSIPTMRVATHVGFERPQSLQWQNDSVIGKLRPTVGKIDPWRSEHCVPRRVSISGRDRSLMIERCRRSSTLGLGRWSATLSERLSTWPYRTQISIYHLILLIGRIRKGINRGVLYTEQNFDQNFKQNKIWNRTRTSVILHKDISISESITNLKPCDPFYLEKGKTSIKGVLSTEQNFEQSPDEQNDHLTVEYATWYEKCSLILIVVVVYLIKKEIMYLTIRINALFYEFSSPFNLVYCRNWPRWVVWLLRCIVPHTKINRKLETVSENMKMMNKEKMKDQQQTCEGCKLEKRSRLEACSLVTICNMFTLQGDPLESDMLFRATLLLVFQYLHQNCWEMDVDYGYGIVLLHDMHEQKSNEPDKLEQLGMNHFLCTWFVFTDFSCCHICGVCFDSMEQVCELYWLVPCTTFYFLWVCYVKLVQAEKAIFETEILTIEISVQAEKASVYTYSTGHEYTNCSDFPW